jgi:hypothetical protein
MARFAQPDWSRLAEAWKERSPVWQSRLAEVLLDAPPVPAGPILTELNRHLPDEGCKAMTHFSLAFPTIADNVT